MRREDGAVDVVKRAGALQFSKELVELLLIVGRSAVDVERNDGLDSIETIEGREKGGLFFGSREGYMNVIVVFACETVWRLSSTGRASARRE